MNDVWCDDSLYIFYLTKRLRVFLEHHPINLRNLQQFLSIYYPKNAPFYNITLHQFSTTKERQDKRKLGNTLKYTFHDTTTNSRPLYKFPFLCFLLFFFLITCFGYTTLVFSLTIDKMEGGVTNKGLSMWTVTYLRFDTYD